MAAMPLAATIAASAPSSAASFVWTAMWLGVLLSRMYLMSWYTAAPSSSYIADWKMGVTTAPCTRGLGLPAWTASVSRRLRVAAMKPPYFAIPIFLSRAASDFGTRTRISRWSPWSIFERTSPDS